MKTRVIEISSDSLEKLKKLKERGIWLVKVKHPFSKKPDITFYRGTQSVPSDPGIVKEVMERIREEASELGRKAVLMEVELWRKRNKDEGVIARLYTFVFDFSSEPDSAPKIHEETFLLKPKE